MKCVGLTPYLPGRANKAFENLETLRGVDGLDEHVTFLYHGKDNLSGIDGVIHESTVARKIRAGEVTTIDGQSIGNLTRVSNDGLPFQNKIDTVTDNFAIQIKTKQAGNVGTPVLGSPIDEAVAYCDLMVEQATALNKTPALITNAPLTQELIDLLDSKGIKWLVVAP